MRWWPAKTWQRVLLVGIVLLAAAAYVALRVLYPRHATPAQISAQMRTQSALQGPAKIWAATCAHCHAPSEGAPVGPVLAGRQLPPEAVKILVRQGVRSMPAFPPSQISDTELQALAQFVNQLTAPVGPTKP